MYRGIDENDGQMSLFAVTTGLDGNKIVAVSPDLGEGDLWLNPTPFLKMAEKDMIFFDPYEFYQESITKAELVWEN